MHAHTVSRAVAGLAVLLPIVAMAQVPPHTSPEPTLHSIVSMAWQRSSAVRTLVARQDEAAAGQTMASSWLAAAPTVGISQRSDRWTDQRDRRESELSLSAPIWLPGQKSRRAELAQAVVGETLAQLEQAKLDIAGLVRSRYWEAAATRETEAEKEVYWRHLQQLASEVDRRVKAGDLARSDNLLAQNEALSAQSEYLRARRAARESLSRFVLLTGLPTLPTAMDEPPPPASALVAVRLQTAQSAERRARAAVAASRAQPGAAPTIALTMRREREGVASPSDRSIGIAVQIPLVGNLRNRPAETAAATQLATASAELAMTEGQLAADIELARQQVLDAETALQSAQQRATAMQDHALLFGRAFAAGERSLADLLRSSILSHEAQVALRQQRIALGLARAELNQSLGIIP